LGDSNTSDIYFNEYHIQYKSYKSYISILLIYLVEYNTYAAIY